MEGSLKCPESSSSPWDDSNVAYISGPTIQENCQTTPGTIFWIFLSGDYSFPADRRRVRRDANARPSQYDR